MEKTKKKKTLKVLLINPPQRYYSESLGFNVYFPLGLLNIAASIRDLCQVKIFDCLVEDFEIQKTPEYTAYGTSLDKLADAVKTFSPDIVGITIPFSAQSDSARAVGMLCKKISGKIVVVCGGPHACVQYQSLLDEGWCDLCVVGEGEMTARELIEKLSLSQLPQGVPGVDCKAQGKLFYVPRPGLKELDQLAMPAYDLIDVQAYLKSPYLYKSRSAIGSRSISMITSRGCPFDCIFCSIKLHMGRAYRYHSPEYVIKHLRFCVEKLGINKFHFEDDNISLNKERFEKLLDLIIASKLDIRWDTPNGIRADTLDFNLLKKIKQSGCGFLRVAIESGNQRVLNEIIRKNSSLEYVTQVVKFCKELDIKVAAFYVIGFPGEKITEMKETVTMAKDLFRLYNVYPILLFATPLYGTELYDICLKEGWIKAEAVNAQSLATATQFYGNPLIATKDFTPADLKAIACSFETEMDELIGKGKGSLAKMLTQQSTLYEE